MGYGLGGWLGGYTGYYPPAIPGPYIQYILASGPYLGPNEGNSMRFLKMGLEWVQIWPQNDLNIDLRMTLQDPTHGGPQMALRSPYPWTSETHGPE